ncbi:MAG: EF-P lysine aminoacylase GenX [Bdellovibrionales bacterium]|nr:EF-P lysine aminoacylase GenX [Bdellovibrionales bacterium]
MPFLGKTLGRILAIEEDKVLLLRRGQRSQVKVKATHGAKPGDWVAIDPKGHVEVLTASKITADRMRRESFTQRISDPRRLKGMKFRSQVESGIRNFFLRQDFLETRTPLLVPCPGMETHIRPIATTTGAYLPTSPEFAMKRLLVGGLEKIFQICPAFRSEPKSTTHHPEFTMLEWYRAFSGYEDVMADVENLFEKLAMDLFGKPEIQFQGKRISVKTPWPRLRVRDLFQEFVGIDLVQNSKAEDLWKHCQRLNLKEARADESWDDLYFRIWMNCIEPRLPDEQAVFVTRYPASQSALAVIDQDSDGTSWAKRFEVYAAGLELGNAFEELTNPIEQRKRFEKDMETRVKTYGPEFPSTPIDEGFIQALEEGMPPSAGIAMGVDRMVMLFADEPDLDYTLWLGSTHTDPTN